MTPQEFVSKWANPPLRERQIAQPHFLDVCRLVGIEMPADGRTESGELFLFEPSLKLPSGTGFADVYYENHFAIEYKTADKYRDLEAAYEQLLKYRENLNNPPLLVVTDFNHWEIHTNFPNTEKRIYKFNHSEIASDTEKLAWLRSMFDDPDRLNPGRNTEQVTKEAAKSLQVITDNMRGWNTDPTRIAFFATKLVFCLFAEDIGLLPRIRNTPTGIFTDVIKQSQGKPEVFKRHLQNLFNEMNRGGEYFGEDIKYFNGTLFSVVTVEALSLEAIDALAKAAALNWESIEPSIFGTLFERSLDPAKRSQLGAHYTSREDILLIIEPVLMQPLRYEWDTAQLEAAPVRERYDNPQDRRERVNAGNQLLQLRERVLKSLRETTVLDPACGSGNFLYVALQELMDLEKEVINHELWDGLQMPLPAVHPRQMFGIEIAPIAHALASIVVWIGYIQWRIKNGYGRTFSEPILEKLQGNIVCKDAILPPAPAPHPPAPSPTGREGELGSGEPGPHPPAPSPTGREGELGAGEPGPHPPAPSPTGREGELGAGEPGPHPPAPSPTGREGELGAGEPGPHPPAPSPTGREGELGSGEPGPHPPAPSPKMREGEETREKWDIAPELERRMQMVAREFRRNPTPAEGMLWQAIRKRQLDGRKFRRQVAIGPFVVDFYCSSERLAVEVDGPIHEDQREADRIRQELLESLGIRFVRLTNSQVENHLHDALNKIRATFAPTPKPSPKMREGLSSLPASSPVPSSPSLPVGEGAGGWGVEWPKVDVIVGNPPFLGNKKMWEELGDQYYSRLKEYYYGVVPNGIDLVGYWFELARQHIVAGKAKRAGLLATNSIRDGLNREVLKRVKQTGDIFMAWSDRDWILDGAAVRVSMVGFDDGTETDKSLDGLPVASVNPDLTADVDITGAKVLRENQLLSFQGVIKRGAFDIPESVAREMIKADPINREVLKPIYNAIDITRRPRNMWIIDFGVNTPREAAKRYELPFAYVEQNVKPQRERVRQEKSRRLWWLHESSRPMMRSALAPLPRYIVTPIVARHRVFVWMSNHILPDKRTFTFARQDDYFFGVLHSTLHEIWSLRLGSWHGKGNDPRYTNTTTFETFPFPWSPGDEDESHPAHAAISAAAKQLHQERDAWLNPAPTPNPSPKMREGLSSLPASSQEPSSPSLPVGEGAGGWGAKELKDRTLTNLYNALQVFRGRDSMKVKSAAAEFAPRLDELHRALDEAVCDAYGWEYGVLYDEEEILRRLLAMNLARAAQSR